MEETYIVYDKNGKLVEIVEVEAGELFYIPEGGTVRRVIGEGLSVGLITEDI